MSSRLGLLDLPASSMRPLLDKQREAARMFALGMTNKEVAEAVGYHPAYMCRLKNQNPKFAEHLGGLREARDVETRDLMTRIKEGASLGLDILLKAVTPGTAEHTRADLKLQVKVAQDLLDREGTAPKVSRTHSTSQNLHAVLTADDIASIREQAAAARAQGLVRNGPARRTEQAS